MKNLLLLTGIFFASFSFSQETNIDAKPKLEIRTENAEDNIHRKTNEHKVERIELKKDDRKDHTHKPTQERHRRPLAEGKRSDATKVERHKKEHHHDKRREQRRERIHERKERRETSPKG
jgi:hypothetical protein